MDTITALFFISTGAIIAIVISIYLGLRNRNFMQSPEKVEKLKVEKKTKTEEKKGAENEKLKNSYSLYSNYSTKKNNKNDEFWELDAYYDEYWNDFDKF